MTWSAAGYVTFEDERTRPVRDLLAAIPALPALEAHSAVDIGCGPGNSTELLAQRFPHARVSGFDSSPDMIAAARLRLPQLDFAVLGLDDWLTGRAAAAATATPVDVLLANAVLQWVPNHVALFPALVNRLARGGVLAVQMPDNLEQPAHRLMREVAAAGPWAAALARVSEMREPIAPAAWYYDLLRPHCRSVDVWLTTYHHPLAGGAAGVVEWFKGSGLRPFLDPLDLGGRAQFLERYTAAVAHAHPPLPDGTVLLPFPRLFIVAVR